MLKKYLFLIICFLPLYFQAQDVHYNFTNHSTETGLPTNSIQYVYPDSHGFLWLATFDGLFRWDGYTVKKYAHEENDQRSLNNNIVYCLYEDRRGRLWVGTIEGLSLYDYAADSFSEFPVAPYQKVPVNSIVEDKEGQLWLGTSQGLCRYSFENKKVRWFREETDRDVIFCMTVDADNAIWIGTFNKGLKKFSPFNGAFRFFRHNQGDTASLASDKIRSLLADSEGRIWVGTEDRGVTVLNREGQLLKQYTNLSARGKATLGTVNCLYEDKYHTIWMGVRSEQLYRIGKGSMQAIPVSTTSLNSSHLPVTSVTSIREDRFGNTWFASASSGLFQTNASKNVFHNYFYDPSNIDGNRSGVVSALHEDAKGTVWIGTNGNGVFRMDSRTGRLSRPATPRLATGIVSDIKGDKEGRLWIASWGNGILRYNPATGNLKQYLYDPDDANSLIYNDAKALLTDDSLVWIGTHGEGLAVLNVKTNHFIHYKNNDVFPFSLHEPAWINHLFKDKQSRLWISTYNGLFVYDGKSLRHFEHTYLTTSLSGNSVNMVTEDAHGKIWVVSESGLDQYEESAGCFVRFGARLRLPGSLKSIVAGPDSLLWIGSTRGLIALHPQSRRVKYYDANDGLADNAFFQKAVLHAKSGELYFGSPKGFSLFHPTQLKKLSVPSFFNFTDVYVYNERQHPGGKNSPLRKVLAQTDTLVLNPDQAFFSIGFEAINLYAPERTQYSYKLVGLHNQWIAANGDRKISFMNLQPGTYQLKARFTDMNGDWHEAPKILTLVILPAWWQTWWFRLVVAAGCIMSILIVFYTRVAAVKRRNRLLKEEVRKSTNDLRKVNESLVEQRDKINVQKETLALSNEEMKRQSDKILLQQRHIISQNHELENNVKRLEESNATKDHFFSILAHDLKNPVFSLTEMAAFVKNNLPKIEPGEMEEFVKGMHRSSQSVYELLTNLLNWSRTQVNTMVPKPVAVDLHVLVEKSRLLLEAQLHKKNILFSNSVDPAHLAFADGDMVDVVIRNIIGNAIKFTDYNGAIEATSIEEAGAVVLCIRDNGVGIKREQLATLFQIDRANISSGTAGERGTGLGLVVSREFVEKNNGIVRVESTWGKGSSFFIQLPAPELPLLADFGPAIEIQSAPATLPLDVWETVPLETMLKVKGRKILLVDDNAELRTYLKIIVSDVFEVFEAADGHEALTIAAEVVPSVIISDILMPGMNGLQFCKEIKNRTDTSHIPVVLLTSRSDEEAQISGYEAGADLYLNKPVKKEVIIQVVLNLLHSQERTQENLVERLMNGEPIPTETTSLTKADEEFLNRLVECIEANLSEPGLDARFLCKNLATSRTVLYTKLKTLTAQTVHEFIKSVRLRKSLKLLQEGKLSVSQVAVEVGFNSHSYFDRCFTKQYKMSPKEYVQKRKGKKA